jgi:adenylate kinase family enzyme
MPAPAFHYPALLLVGPTGAGKTPLGELLEAEGLWGRRCLHFDFGKNLRRAAAGEGPASVVTPEERKFLVWVLQTGALLEDEQFPVARKLLLGFLAGRGADAQTLAVMNGLPRHVGQAEALEPALAMETVVHLACEAEVVLERIRTNAGGDRAGRSDDRLEDIRRRLLVFRGRTTPLLDYYHARQVRVLTIAVGMDTTAAEIRKRLEMERPDVARNR